MVADADGFHHPADEAELVALVRRLTARGASFRSGGGSSTISSESNPQQPDPGTAEEIPAHPGRRDRGSVDTSIAGAAPTPMPCVT